MLYSPRIMDTPVDTCSSEADASITRISWAHVQTADVLSASRREVIYWNVISTSRVSPVQKCPVGRK